MHRLILAVVATAELIACIVLMLDLTIWRP
jgi:hypothetical protein